MYKFLLNQILYVNDLKDGKPYECVVIENDDEVGKVKIHFKGWGATHDEWIEHKSDRINRSSNTVDNTELKIALGDLIRIDEITEKVIPHYDSSKSLQHNEDNLYKQFNVNPIQECAKSLNIPVMIEGTKNKTHNKRELIKKILQKIVSALPHTCRECQELYRVKTDEVPLFSCHNCRRGSHSCEKISNFKNSFSTLLSGFVWLCEDCHDASVQSADGANNNSVTEQIVIDTEDKLDEIPEVNQDTVGKSNTPVNKINSTISRPICKKFKVGKCRHGINGNKLVDGKSCSFNHPKHCRNYCGFGLGGKKGCRWGSKCKFYHPALCRTSERERKCFNESCSFVHFNSTVNSIQYASYVKDKNMIDNNRIQTKTDRVDHTKNDRLGRIEQMMNIMKNIQEQEMMKLRSEMMLLRGLGVQWPTAQTYPVQNPHISPTSHPMYYPMPNQSQSNQSLINPPAQMTGAAATIGSTSHLSY